MLAQDRIAAKRWIEIVWYQGVMEDFLGGREAKAMGERREEVRVLQAFLTGCRFESLGPDCTTDEGFDLSG